MAKAKIHIGTSGWFYEHWNEVFYPEDISSDQRLKYYSQFFDTVEINNTFYRFPNESVVDGWHKKVPKHFIFSAKLSQYVTHIKRLNDCTESVVSFVKRMERLKKKQGPILIQLPPSFKKNLELLESFCRDLPKKHPFAIEFRHPTWYDEETYAFLRKQGIALCITDLKGKLSPLIVTSHFVYIRLHGPKNAYSGEYGSRRLHTWKKRIEKWLEESLSIYCYFDNDEKSFAVKDAKKLREILGNL